MSEIERELRFVRAGLEAVLKRMEARLSRPVAVSMEDAAAMTGLGLTKFKQLVRKRVFNTFLVDRRRLVRVQELEDWAARESVAMMPTRRQPKTKGRTESEKILAKMRR